MRTWCLFKGDEMIKCALGAFLREMKWSINAPSVSWNAHIHQHLRRGMSTEMKWEQKYKLSKFCRWFCMSTSSCPPRRSPVCVCVFVCVCVCVCVFGRRREGEKEREREWEKKVVRLSMCVWINGFMCMCIYICVCRYVCAFTYICINIYIQT